MLFQGNSLMPANQNSSSRLELKTKRKLIRAELANLERHITKNQQMQDRLVERIRILMQERRAA